MPFTLIKGTFHVKGYSPDGDSVKFRANRRANWKKLDGKAVRPNSKDHVQLRVEAIDSLETHYGRDPESHQPTGLAYEATDELLAYLGIGDVIWGDSHKRVTSANDGTEGFILARSTGPYGRPICFVFSGSINKADGSEVFLDAALLKKSLNYRMLGAGHAYPLFYETLFYDLRNVLAGVVSKARTSMKGLWPEDKTNSGVPGLNLSVLEDKAPIFPKLFRRLVDHIRSGEPLSKFPERLGAEKITIVPTVQHTHFDTVVKIEGKKVRMTEKPEDLVFGTVIR